MTFRLALVQLLMPLQTEQLISHTRATLIDTFTFLQGSDGGVIAASELHELFTMIYDILDSAVSKWIGDMACILACLNSASRWHCEVWAFQFPFLHNIKDSISASEDCLYSHINWLLAQAH